MLGQNCMPAAWARSAHTVAGSLPDWMRPRTFTAPRRKFWLSNSSSGVSKPYTSPIFVLWQKNDPSETQPMYTSTCVPAERVDDAAELIAGDRRLERVQRG